MKKITKKLIILISLIAIFALLPTNQYAKARLADLELKIKRVINKAEPEVNFCEINICEVAREPVKKTLYVTVTAYSSTPDQTDSTPFITANGTYVHDGTLAANFLPFGAQVRFPEYSGDKIYIIEDRMHPRFSNRADIWFPTRQQAINFGKRKLKMEVI